MRLHHIRTRRQQPISRFPILPFELAPRPIILSLSPRTSFELALPRRSKRDIRLPIGSFSVFAASSLPGTPGDFACSEELQHGFTPASSDTPLHHFLPPRNIRRYGRRWRTHPDSSSQRHPAVALMT